MDRIEYLRAADGRVVPRQNQTQFVLILVGLLVMILLVLGAIVYRARHPETTENRIQLMAAQTLVRSELQPAPDDRLQFSSADETEVKALGTGRFMVRGWVDRISAEGQAQRFDFSCTVQENAGGDWVRESLSLFPQ